MLIKIYSHLKSFSPIVLDQILVSGLSFAMALYLVRLFGLSVFGQYSIIMVITMLCLEIQRSIIISPMMVLYHDYDNKELYLISISTLQKITTLALTLFSGIVIYASHWFSPKWQISQHILPAIFFITSRLQLEYFRKYFFLINKPSLSLLADIQSSAIIIIGIILIRLYFIITLEKILYLFSISYFLSSLFLIIKSNTELILKYCKPTILQHWKIGKWLTASSVTTYISGDLLILFGSTMIGSTAAGIIKSSQYIMGGMMIVFQSMESIIPRLFSHQIRHHSKHNVNRLFLACIFTIALITLLHGLFIYKFLDIILRWINSGPYTSDQYTIAIGYIIFSFIISINYVMNYLLRAYKMTHIIFITSLITSIVMLLTSYSLIQEFNVYGIFTGLFITQFIIMIIYGYHCRQALK